jgi:ABC-2 type transport system ATP-binding protein
MPENSARPAIVLNKLSKRYGKSPKLALDGLSITVNEGEVYGFLGPNGAGKSTAIRMLMNFIQPTSGSAQIMNMDIVKDSVQVKNSVGYLSGDFAVYPKMTGRQYLRYMSELRTADNKYMKTLETRLKADIHKKSGELSRGSRQKIGIIQAFMHKPQILILDEPTSGLDPLMQDVFYSLVKDAKDRGAAIFISSHVLSEVQKICDRIGVIREGKLIEERIMSELTMEASQTFDISFAGKVPISELKKVTGLQSLKVEGHNVTLHFHGNLSPLFAVLAKHTVTKMDTRTLDLEEVFLGMYKDKGGK